MFITILFFKGQRVPVNSTQKLTKRKITSSTPRVLNLTQKTLKRKITTSPQTPPRTPLANKIIEQQKTSVMDFPYLRKHTSQATITSAYNQKITSSPKTTTRTPTNEIVEEPTTENDFPYSNKQKSETTTISVEKENISMIYKELEKIAKNQEGLAKNQKIIMKEIFLLRKEMKLNVNKSSNHNKIKDIILPLKAFEDFENLNKLLKTDLEAREILVNNLIMYNKYSDQNLNIFFICRLLFSKDPKRSTFKNFYGTT